MDHDLLRTGHYGGTHAWITTYNAITRHTWITTYDLLEHMHGSRHTISTTTYVGLIYIKTGIYIIHIFYLCCTFSRRLARSCGKCRFGDSLKAFTLWNNFTKRVCSSLINYSLNIKTNKTILYLLFDIHCRCGTAALSSDVAQRPQFRCGTAALSSDV